MSKKRNFLPFIFIQRLKVTTKIILLTFFVKLLQQSCQIKKTGLYL